MRRIAALGLKRLIGPVGGVFLGILLLVVLAACESPQGPKPALAQQPGVASPTPTAVPTATPLPTPTPRGPTPTPLPGATPTRQPIATPVSTPTPAPLRGDAQRGVALYVAKSCDVCHGQGGRGTDMAPAHNSAEFAQKHPTDATIAQIVRNGRGGMPPYDSTTLTEQELLDIIAYIRSLR